MALYDPNERPAEVTTDFTLDDVLAWARTKPADGNYDYADNGNCAICQFLKESRRARQPRAGGSFWMEGLWGDAREFPEGLERALIAPTYGRLVRRLEAARGQ